ncbi:hypothetical protein D3C87_457280 [compost metagenome]
MNAIFLRAKHWQIFVPLIVIPFAIIIGVGIASVFIINMVENNTDRAEDLTWPIYFLPLVSVLCGFIQFAWFWSVLTKLSTLLPYDRVRMPAKRIKVFFFIPIVYFCLIPLFIVFIIRNTANPEPAQIVQMISIGISLFFLHLFSVFCLFHTIYFAAKTIASAELQRNATFSDFAADFFLIWLFPIGIWFVQPRINKLVDKANGLYPNEGLVDRF